MEVELVKAWITLNAPESIRYDLIEGLELLEVSRKKRAERRERFPNNGNRFTEEEDKRIMELDIYLTTFINWSYERDMEIEKEFGRPLKSIKSRLKRIKSK